LWKKMSGTAILRTGFDPDLLLDNENH